MCAWVGIIQDFKLEQKVILFLQLCGESKSGVLEYVVATTPSPKALLEYSAVSLGQYGWAISSQPRHTDLTQQDVLGHQGALLTDFS